MAPRTTADPDTARRKLAGLPWEAALSLYAELLSTHPDATAVCALVLRDKARAGELPVEAVPLLTVCLVDAPNAEALSQLAKALAAFGRDAQMAAAPLVEKLERLVVDSDAALWAWDGCIHALGYMGGPAAAAFLQDVATRDPAPVVKARRLYRGALPEDERLEIMADSVADSRARLGLPDPGPRWTGKTTARQASAAAPSARTAPWMTRGR